MTLSVNAYYIDSDGNEVDIAFPSESTANNVAGFESCRNTFYGSDQVKELGLNLLPLLKNQAVIYAEGDELETLQSEINILLSNLEKFDEIYWGFRLNNILTAIKLAKNFKNGRVSIG